MPVNWQLSARASPSNAEPERLVNSITVGALEFCPDGMWVDEKRDLGSHNIGAPNLPTDGENCARYGLLHAGTGQPPASP